MLRREGATPRLTGIEHLGSSGRGGVLRVSLAGPGLPASVIVKWFTGPVPGGDQISGHGPDAGADEVCQDEREVFSARRYLAELIGAELTAGAMGVSGPYGHDNANLLIVLPDHGRWPTLADALDGPPDRTRAATVAWARCLAKVHAALRGCRSLDQARWRELAGSALPSREESLPCDYWRAAAADAGSGWPCEAAGELDDCYRFLRSAPAWDSFCLADMCPGNALLTDDGVIFCDFEWSGPGNGLLDLAALGLGFAGCQQPRQVDEEIVRAAERAYLLEYAAALEARAEPAPSAADLAAGLLRASAVRLWWDNCDQPPSPLLAPPDLAERRSRLLARLRRFVGQARRLDDLPALTGVAERLITVWTARWPGSQRSPGQVPL